MQKNFAYYQQYPNIESNQYQYPNHYTQNGYFCYPYSSNQVEYEEKEEKWDSKDLRKYITQSTAWRPFFKLIDSFIIALSLYI